MTHCAVCGTTRLPLTFVAPAPLPRGDFYCDAHLAAGSPTVHTEADFAGFSLDMVKALAIRAFNENATLRARVSQLEATVAGMYREAHDRAQAYDDNNAFHQRRTTDLLAQLTAEHTARLAAEQETDRLRAALQDIAEPSSYPIDPADAFYEAMERAHAALRGPVA